MPNVTFEFVNIPTDEKIVAGDIAAVYEYRQAIGGVGARGQPAAFEKGVSTPRTRYFHVMDMPGEISGIRSFASSTYAPPVYPEDPHSGGILHPYSHCILIDNMRQESRDELEATGQTSVNWSEGQNLIWSKVDQATIAEVYAALG